MLSSIRGAAVRSSHFTTVIFKEEFITICIITIILADRTDLRVKEHTYELPLMCLSKVVSFTGGFHQKKEGFILFRKGMDVEVWLCNDLESEYLNLIRQQRGRGFQSCEAQGSFVFDLNSHYVLKANVKVVAKCMRTRTKTEQDLDTWKLFGAKPFCVSYALQPIDQTLGPRYTLMFEIYRDDDKTPLTKTKIKIESQERDSEVLSSGSMESEEEIDSDSDYNSEDDSDSDTESESDRNPLLDKEGEDNHASVTIEELISYCLESIDELLNFSIKEAKRCPIVHESVISFMKEVAEDLEKKRFNTDRKIIGGSFLGAVGGGLTVASIATAPITAGVSTGLLVPGIILSVGGGACNIHSVVHKHRFDKKKKQKIEEDLTAFVQFQSELLKSIVILFKSRQTVLAIRNNLSNKWKKAKCMNKKDFEAAVARYKENAQHTCNDFFEVVHHVFSQSKDVESIVNKIKSSQENLPGGIKFAVQRTPFSMKNVFVVLPFVMKYQAKRNTYLQFCKKVLNPESATKKELPSALFIGADAGKSLLGAGTGIGARVCNGIEDATKILKIARGIAIVGYLLGGLGIALDIGTMVFAIADLLKKDKQKLTKAVLECIEMVEDINDICLSI